MHVDGLSNSEREISSAIRLRSRQTVAAMKSNVGDILISAVEGDVTERAARDSQSANRESWDTVPNDKQDEVEIDFSDTRSFCMDRWVVIVKATIEKLTASGNCSPRTNINTN